MVDFIDKTSEQSGTPLNRNNLMAIQGFEAKQTVFNSDGSIIETNAIGQKKITSFNQKTGAITETFYGEKTITKTTTFEEDGSIKEVIL